MGSIDTETMNMTGQREQDVLVNTCKVLWIS